ncbi:MAG: beta-ketoacyl-[acyl-carrier-protein] synthase family protein [Planctomycetaceae bacterium]|nr:beta-ketoacyl-[acyl-carrier-protein] synthase family protein [Planctomycetaceae bacterium]
MKRRVVITGMGTVNPLAHTVEETWSALLGGQSGFGPITTFDATTFPSRFAAMVKDYHLEDHVPDAARHATAGRHTHFAIGAAVQAWQAAGLAQRDTLDREALGLYLGSGEGRLDFDNFMSCIIDSWRGGAVDTAAWAKLAFHRMELYREVEQEANMVLAHLANRFGVAGPAYNVLTACAASTQAIGEAASQIRAADIDAAITGGAHSMVHTMAITGFTRLTALSRRNDEMETASRPFDLTRDGFVIGEGATIMILEEYRAAKKRGAPMLAEIVGYGSSADAYRITDQDPEGAGAAAAMTAALADAGLSPKQINYINAHGTGTKQNDIVETRAVKAAFGRHAPAIPISSVKSQLGHLIGAAGATELMTCVLALRDGTIPPTAHLTTPDPDCDLDYVPNTPRKAKLKYVMSNSMGFGGQNNSLIIAAVK